MKKILLLLIVSALITGCGMSIPKMSGGGDKLATFEASLETFEKQLEVKLALLKSIEQELQVENLAPASAIKLEKQVEETKISIKDLRAQIDDTQSSIKTLKTFS